MVFAVLAWILFSLVVGAAANTRGRNPLAWTFIALLISPLIAGPFVLVLPDFGRGFGVDDQALRRNIQRSLQAAE
jgi:hypothetical protein